MDQELEPILRDNVYPITLDKGQLLQEPSTVNDIIYFIEHGLVRLFGTFSGREYTMGFRREDQFIITVKDLRFDADSPWHGIEVLEDCKLWCIPGDLARGLRVENFRFALQYEQIVVRDWIAIQNSGACSRRNGGVTNFHFFQRHFPELVTRVPIQYLANFTQIPENKLKKLLESSLKDQTV